MLGGVRALRTIVTALAGGVTCAACASSAQPVEARSATRSARSPTARVVVSPATQSQPATVPVTQGEASPGGATPLAVFLTHSELPHSGNLQKVTEAWPDIRVYVSNILLSYIELAPVLPIDQITNVKPGSNIDFAGRELIFLNALLKDQPGSQWIFDPLTRTLFTGDGFGYYHAPGECNVFSGEMAEAFKRSNSRPITRTLSGSCAGSRPSASIRSWTDSLKPFPLR